MNTNMNRRRFSASLLSAAAASALVPSGQAFAQAGPVEGKDFVRVETLLNGWLDSTKNTDFESDYVAMAFDELVDFVNLLRDIAQDFCV